MDAWDVLYANGGSTNKDAWDLLHSVHVVENNSPIYVKIEDKTSATVTVSENAKVVTVKGGSTPHISVSYTGGRGPIWLPGNTYDGTSLAAILAGYIGKAQLAQDLLADIDSTITGLVDARAELASAIQANIENGTRIDDVVSRITQAEGTLELSVAKLNAAEANISNAQVFIDDASVRLSAAEGSISNASNYIATQETILSNEWTVKIQENSDGTACVAGTGLLVYPTWKLDTVYDIDDYSWFDGNAYKAIIAHTASEENVPLNASYWQLIPYATKSQFGVLAESFFVQTSTGEKAIPFIVQDDQVLINGDLTVNGLVKAGALSTNKVWSWSIQSQNYVSGTSGYSINAITGHAEFNNIDLTVNYGDVVDTPNLSNFVTSSVLNQNIASLQAQIDGGFTTWYYEGEPTLSNEPAINWTTNELKDIHVGDLYYDELTGSNYRFKNDTGYEWFQLPNTELSLALANAAAAQDTADHKRRVFVTTPVAPYDEGDLWVDGTVVKYATVSRTSAYNASDWVNTASLGAPIGTLVGGVAATTIASAVTNFNASNDRNATAVVAPTLNTSGSCVDHAIRTDGCADISFEWLWSGSAGDIDGFHVLVYQSTLNTAYTIGTTPVNEQVYTIPANKRAFILYGVTANLYYTFAVRAYRSVDKDINANGLIASAFVKSNYAGENPYQPSTTVAYAGNITGTINGITAANVNVWSSITGSGKPSDNATVNAIYRQAAAPTGGTYTTGDLWYNTGASPATLNNWNGSSWIAVANTVTNTNQITDGAGLGTTATWDNVSGTGKPANNADVTQTAIDNTVDTTTGGLIVRDSSLQRYAHLTGGDLEFYDYYDDGWHPYKSVTKTVTGVCSDGETINLGYFREQPKVLISPYDLQVYNSSYPNQSQKFALSASNIRKNGNDWFFDASARLVLSSGISVLAAGALKSIDAGPIVNTASGYDLVYLNWDAGGLGALPLNPDESFSTQTTEMLCPTCTRSVNVIVETKRVWVTEDNGDGISYLANISVVLYLDLYNVTTGWNEAGSASLTAIRSAVPVTLNANLVASSNYDITKIRIRAVFTLSNPAAYYTSGTLANYTQSIQIISCTCTLTSAQISAYGKASYLAIG